MDILKLQEGLLDWFWLTPLEVKKLQAIDNICSKLYEQYFPEKKGAKYELFYPLLRFGVIEFYGSNEYALSPSFAIYKNDTVAFTNVPLNYFSGKFSSCHFESKLGIAVCQNLKPISPILIEITIPFTEYDLLGILRQFPTFDSIITGWREDVISDSSKYSFWTKTYQWAGKDTAMHKGVYKKSQEAYSQRGIKLSEREWKKIPLRGDNIDAFNIAILWQQIQNGENLETKFQVSTGILTIENIFFPIVLERLLFLNTILQPQNGVDAFKRQYIISKREFTTLNRLLGNKIELI